jgi:(p)ppGpp synthase/HD superfamily hydrolase
MNNWSREKYINAWNFAAAYHAGQTYGGPKPDIRVEYMSHIGTVVMEINWVLQRTDQPYNADLAIQCAILHDTIEDTDASYEQIWAAFGVAVANGVMALTKNEQLPTKKEQMQDSLVRIRQQPMEVWMVKMADRISNLYHPPYYWTSEKKEAYLQESELIYQALHTADALLAVRLKEKMAQYVQFVQN